LIKTEKHGGVYDAISFHPDIMFHHIANERVVYAPGTSPHVVKRLEFYGFKLIEGGTVLKPYYPYDIAYNVARVGKFAFHNLKYTDHVLKRELENTGVELVHVNQGYTKCSISVIDQDSIITSDKGIAKAAEKRGLDVLLIKPEEGILLPGVGHGFIGGSSGMIDKDKWMIAGDFKSLESCDVIKKFLEKKGISCIYVHNQPVTDIGSIIPLLTR